MRFCYSPIPASGHAVLGLPPVWNSALREVGNLAVLNLMVSARRLNLAGQAGQLWQILFKDTDIERVGDFPFVVVPMEDADKFSTD